MMYKTFEKKLKKMKGAIPEGVNRLTFSKAEHEDLGQIVLAHDPITEQVNDDEFMVTPVAIYEHRLYVVCPFCGQVHLHGVCNGDYSGTRTADCGHGHYKIKPVTA